MGRMLEPAYWIIAAKTCRCRESATSCQLVGMAIQRVAAPLGIVQPHPSKG